MNGGWVHLFKHPRPYNSNPDLVFCQLASGLHETDVLHTAR